VVAIEAQRDALVNQRDRGAVEIAAQLEVAVQGDADRPRAGEIEPGRWQRAQDLALVREPLGDREATGCVDAPVADLIAPTRVLLVELGQAAEPPGRPKARLEMPDAALDRALLAWRRRRARVRVKGEWPRNVTNRSFHVIWSPSRRATAERRLS